GAAVGEDRLLARLAKAAGLAARHLAGEGFERRGARGLRLFHELLHRDVRRRFLARGARLDVEVTHAQVAEVRERIPQRVAAAVLHLTSRIRTTRSRIRFATIVFDERSTLSSTGPDSSDAAKSDTSLSSESNPIPGLPTSFATRRSAPLSASFFFAFVAR